jgi:phage/plasmid-associated DNA primase
MNVGKTAGNGKSTEMSIHEKCFDIYTTKMKKEVFEKGFDKKHKFIIDCLKNPIRLAYAEEMEKKKLDKEFIKDWVDGRKITCEVMFGTQIQGQIQSKLLSCSNYDPNFDNDEGIKRRGKLQYYESKFHKQKDTHLINEETHNYIAIEGFENKFDDALYKNAYFHLLLKYDTLIVPSINEEAFKDTIEEGDVILDEIKENFIITKNPDDRLSYKMDLVKIFGEQKSKDYREKLQQMGIKYHKGLSYKTKQGRFDGIKLTKANEDLLASLEKEK